MRPNVNYLVYYRVDVIDDIRNGQNLASLIKVTYKLCLPCSFSGSEHWSFESFAVSGVAVVGSVISLQILRYISLFYMNQFCICHFTVYLHHSYVILGRNHAL